MSTSITIRDVPDETRDELAARASRGGMSLQTYLRAQMIEFARKPDIESWLERVRDHKTATGSTLSPDAILAHIKADRR
jgi:hypothetical protein